MELEVVISSLKHITLHVQTPIPDKVFGHTQNSKTYLNSRVLKGPGGVQGRGCSWGTLRILAGKIGKAYLDVPLEVRIKGYDQ